MQTKGLLLPLLVVFLITSAGANEKEPEFEVLVLGTHHAPAMFLSPDYTPAHIRAALIAAQPDVVAVESHPKWFENGRFHVVTYEAEGVAVPFAKSRGLPVHGVDWKDIEAWDRSEELRALRYAEMLVKAQARDKDLSPYWFGRLEARQPRPSSSKVNWERINSEEYGKSRYAGKSPEDEDFAGKRDRGIAANCVKVMESYPKKRLAIVIGAHHKPFLDILFSRMAKVRVLKMGRDIPFPSAEQVDRAWVEKDLLCVLGHNLDGGSGYFFSEMTDLRRMKTVLAKLASHPNATRYFRARINILSNETEKAETDLDAIIKSGAEGDIYPFPMREWRMRYTLAEAARVEKARLLLSRDEQEKARALLEPVNEALAFRLKMLNATRPRELRRIQGIDDPGFELGERASDIFAGWDTYLPTDAGQLSFTGDESNRVEGLRSLRVQIKAPNTRGYGFHVRQEISLPATKKPGEMMRFGLSMKGEGLEQARLEITRSYQSRDRKPLAVTIADLTKGHWVRAEVEFPLPEGNQFAIFIKFDGPAGSKLWLDNGAPLPVEYMTIPREWTPLKLACAFPKSLFRTFWTEPQTSVSLKGLKDPGFEKAILSNAPMGGWFCSHIPKHLKVQWDKKLYCEGDKSLLAEVTTPMNPGQASIYQVVTLPPSVSAEFSLALRSSKRSNVLIQVGEWDASNRFHALAQKEIVVKSTQWERPTLKFNTPALSKAVGIYVYIPSEAGLRVWMDDARLGFPSDEKKR